MPKKPSKQKVDSIRKQVREGIKTVITEECAHEVLREILHGDSWYRCDQCGMVVNLYNTPSWSKEAFNNTLQLLTEKTK